MKLKPRPYQEQQLNAIARALLELKINRQLVQSPTGTGKTVTFAELQEWEPIKAWLETFPARERRMLVLAHREELLEQAAEKIRRANPGLLVAIEQAGRRASVHVDVIVASVPTLAALGFRRLDRLLARMRFRICIVDEAHHAAARTYRKILSRMAFLPPMADDDNVNARDLERAVESDIQALEQQLKGWDRIAPKDQLLVGVTATPNRSDEVGLGCVFQSLVYSYPLKDAVRDGWLVPIVAWVVETETSLDAVPVTSSTGDFSQKKLANAVNTDERNLLTVAAWKERAEGRPTIAFTVDVAHAHALAAEFDKAGIRAAAVSGMTPKDERRRLLERFKDGRLEVLCNCMVLTEGTDLPLASCIIHAAPTKSASLYEQKTGRGLRPLPGDPVGPERAGFQGVFIKPDCFIIDVVDVSRRHSLMTAPVLYGLPPGLLAKEPVPLEQLEDDLKALTDEFEEFDVAGALVDGQHLTLEQLRARAVQFDVWNQSKVRLDAALGPGRALSWVQVGNAYELEYPWRDAAGTDGFERVRLAEDVAGRWEITLMFRERMTERGRAPMRRQQTIASQLITKDDAAGVAEQFILQHRRRAGAMKSTGASWRSLPAKETQLALLARMRIMFDAGITRGEASDLIDQKRARR